MLLSYHTTALFLLFSSSLPLTYAQLQPPPPPPPHLNNLTLCSAPNQPSSFWIIGSNPSGGLVAMNYSTNTKSYESFTITGPVISPDTRGKCAVSSDSTRIYYLSSKNIGTITIQEKTASWTDALPNEGTYYGILATTPSTTALGNVDQNSGITVAIVGKNQTKSDVGYTFAFGSKVAREYPEILTNLALVSSDVTDMAISNYSLWIYSALKTSIIQWDFTKNNRTIYNVAAGNSKLVQYWDNSGVVLLQNDPAGKVNATTFPPSNKPFGNIQNSPIGDANLYWFPNQNSHFQINPQNDFAVQALEPALPTPTSTITPIPNTSIHPETPHTSKSSSKGAIIGSIVGVMVLLIAVAAFIVSRKRKTKGRGTIFARKRKDLFPTKNDESVPLGLYHQNRSLPEIPNNAETITPQYPPRPNNGVTHANMMAAGAAPYMVRHEQNISQNTFEEHIPVEAALKHHQYDKHTPQGLTHSISVSSTTSKFPRRNGKSGKRFEEKIQLQVIRYEVQDAHLVSPHGAVGRLVLGTYHIISPPMSARSAKAQTGTSRSLARSGTVVVRRSRIESGSGQGLREGADDSTMLLTDAENQHTFETSTLKWYSTEIHWKREAALLKHLKSPIFVMELLESYCIPALQNRANTYPFVNAMGGCSSLLSNIGPIKTAQHARSILRSISAAVDWCYRRGVVHLNIQPGSFFLEDGIDPSTEDAPWKLWDFTCARFIGEPIGVVGGGNPESQERPRTPQPPPNHLQADAYPYLDQHQVEERQERICGNPLPAAYSAPELLEAWRFGDETFPAEAVMDTWSLGCVYYEVLTGQPLFATEADSWALVGGWDNKSPWTAKNFKVPYPPSAAVSSEIGWSRGTTEQDTMDPLEKSRILDPSGSISQLLQEMLKIHADERITMDSVMERIY